MKRILLVLAGYAVYRWWTRPLPEQQLAPMIALAPPQKRKPQRRKASA